LIDYLVIASSFNRFAGPNNHLRDLCNHLYRAENLRLAVVTHVGPIEAAFLRTIRFPLCRILKGPGSTYGVRLATFPINIAIIRRYVKLSGIEPNNILVNASVDTLFETSLAVGKKIAVGYNVFPNGPSLVDLDRLARVANFTSINRIVAHTFLQKNTYKKLGIDPQKIAVVPSCIDVSKVRNSAQRHEAEHDRKRISRPIVFYAGRLVREKGIRELITCCKRVSSRVAVDLSIVGDGPLRGLVMEEQKRLRENSKHINILYEPGWQPQDVVLSRMVESDLVVLPSYSEMFPRVLLEAMSLSKAILSTLMGGPQEMIEDGISGYLFDPHDAAAFENALLELVSNPSLRQSLGRAAYDRVSSMYDVSVVGRKFRQFLASS